MSESTGPPEQDLAHAALAELVRVLLDTTSVTDVLDELARLAAAIISPSASVGITLRHANGPLTAVCSDQLASHIDEVQYGRGEGPCLEALDTGRMIYTDDLLEEDRWPTYRTRALGHGVRSSLSLPLTVNGDAVGALNLFSMTPHMFGPDVRARAAAFADQAAAAVGLGMRHARQAELSDQLQQALASRAVIDQAMGIVMAQQRCSADDAFAVLRRISQDTNRRVWDVAADLVTTVTGQPPRPPPFRPPA